MLSSILRRPEPRRLGPRPEHVVIVGAGFGGLQAARRLGDRAGQADLRVTLVDRHNYHLFQPLLYQVATAGLDPQDIGHAIRNVVAGDDRVTFRLGEVVGLDAVAKQLHLDDGETLSFDRLILAAGAVPADYGIAGVAEHGYPLKTLGDAVDLRNHLLRAFETAEQRPELVDEGLLTVAIAGGGPTGIEVAGAFAELVDKVLRKDHPTLDVDRVRTILLEPNDALLNGYHPSSQEAAKEALEDRGVEVRLGVGIEEARATELVLSDGSTLPAHTLVWAAGVTASPLAAMLGTETTKGGRVVVDDRLRVPEHPHVSVIGDLAGATGADGELLPQLSPVAMQQGRHVADQIIAERLSQDGPGPFRYLDKGIMATIGRNAAVAELPGGLRLRGFPAWVAWLGVHIVFLVGWRNRASTLVNWAWNYLTFDRGSRLIFDRVDRARAEAAANEVRTAA